MMHRTRSRKSRQFPSELGAVVVTDRPPRFVATFESVRRVTVPDLRPPGRLAEGRPIKSIRTLTNLMIAEQVSPGRHRPISRHLPLR